MSIDYGNGKTNINLKTKIRYGVIPQHDIPYWYDSSEIVMSNCCPYCGIAPTTKRDITDYIRCPNCRKTFKDGDFDEQQIIGYKLDDRVYLATQCQDDCDIFILKSPFFTYAEFCSPCAPGACYLRTPLTDTPINNRAYCFGHDFFEDETAPYPVYSVKTKKLIPPKERK